jgi:zinc protease
MTGLFVGVAVAALCLAQITVGHCQTVTRQTSPAGLTFRHVHMPEDHFQALSFAWKDASAIALAGKEGLADLGTALIMEGPRGASRSAMIEELRDLQAIATLGATASVIQGNLTAPPEKFPAAARLFARALAEPALAEERLAAIARNRVTVSRRAEANAETLAQQLLARLLIAEGPHRRYASGESGIFESVKVEDIDRWRKDKLVRDRLALVAVGPMDGSEAGREIDRLFAGLPPTGSVPPLAKPVLRAPGKLIVLERAVPQTAVAAGGPMLLAVTPDSARTQLAVAALGGGSSSRLWLAVRERLGAAYGISAALRPIDLQTRALFIRTLVAHDKAQPALAAIRGEYARFVADGMTDGELDALKAIFVRNHRERLRRAPSLAASLLNAALHDFPDDYLASYEQRIRGYVRMAIAADARSRFPAPPLTTVVVAPSADEFSADCVIKSPDDLARCD